VFSEDINYSHTVSRSGVPLKIELKKEARKTYEGISCKAEEHSPKMKIENNPVRDIRRNNRFIHVHQEQLKPVSASLDLFHSIKCFTAKKIFE
jgi:hypothetical protein